MVLIYITIFGEKQYQHILSKSIYIYYIDEFCIIRFILLKCYTFCTCYCVYFPLLK